MRHAPAPEGTGLHRLGSWLWWLLVLLVVALAIYVSAGRYLMANMGSLRGQIVSMLNERLPFSVDVGSISGKWLAFSPEIDFRDLVITQGDSGVPPLRIAEGRLRFDLTGSLAARSLQLSQLELAGLSLRATLTDSGSIEIEGFRNNNSGTLQRWLQEFLPRVEGVSLLDSSLLLTSAGRERELTVNLSLTRAGSSRRLQGWIDGPDLRLAVHADGVGNPLLPLSWRGDVYLDIASNDLESLSSLWASLDWPFTLSGKATAEFWLNRAGGDSQARLRVNSAAAHVQERGGAWSLPLDELAFEAALAQTSNHWTLIAEDFHARREDRTLDLSRVQFDWWGSSMRLRAVELGLDSLPTLLAAAPGLPSGLRDALPDLAPAGQLHAVELRLDDLADPAGSWSLRSVLDAVSISSWRGTPAMTGVSGYLELEPGGGRLQLDAAPFSMHFPTVYRDPMHYDEAWGDLRLGWDGAGLRINSGLMHTRGEEGETSALFTVDLPFEERVTGPELELLAGLQHSRGKYRDKYLPFVLPATLLDWLGNSVEEAAVDKAGFLLRGSLLKGGRAHRTVQLVAAIDDARLRFDPAWPPLEDLSAMLRVDDGRTWLWSDSARIYDVRLERLAAHLLPGVGPQRGQATMNLRGALAGDAGDGQRLLVESPLAGLTANTFADWTMSGKVEGTLGLELLFGPPEKRRPPQIDLALQLMHVDARMTALALPVEEINGDLMFSSSEGFSGSALAGKLWGQELSVRAVSAAKEESADSESIVLDIAGAADAGALGPWLDLRLLGFAQGVADVSGTLRLGRGQTPTLKLASNLEGVALDAPRPFRKNADQPLPLALTLELVEDGRLDLSLGERLLLHLELGNQGLRQLLATVGDEQGIFDCDERLCLRGAVSELDLSAWQDFAARYLVPPTDPDAANAAGPVVADELSLVGEATSYRIDSLAVGNLSITDRQFGQARIDLWGRGEEWLGSVESSLVQGSLSREAGGLQLLVEYLDLAEFSGGDSPTLETLRPLLPSMRVDVLELRSEDQRIGSLGFDLDAEQDDGGLYIGAIEGELWGVNLAAGAPGMLAWTPTPEGERTAIEFDLGFADLGDTLAALNYVETLESRRGSAAVRLGWPGSPSNYAAQAMDGSLQISLEDGRLLEAKPGALSMVTFFNLAEILRRLSLAHMFETGIPFETASSELEFMSGVMEIRDLQIDGAASEFQFSGRRNLSSGEIDGELVVTLPVASNLPWVAALAGGPAVAAGVFVVSKVFEKQVNRMSSAVYDVSGGIDDPQVSFRRLFDDRPSRRPEPAPSAVEDADVSAVPDPASVTPGAP